MVLFIDESESVARQLKRGRQIVAHNEEVARSGMGERLEERATDFSEGLARNRYRVFKEQTYDALVSLREIFHYHFINAQASIPEARPTFFVSSITRACWNWTRAPSTGFAACRWPAKSSSTRVRTSFAGWTATSWSSRKSSGG